MSKQARARYRNYVTFRLEWVASKARAAADTIYLRDCGLDIRQLRILRRVAENPGLTVSEIVEATMFERTLVSRLLSDLVAMKLLVRRIAEEDARQFRIDLTPEGLARVEAADGLGDALNDDLMAMLDPQERVIFDRCLEKLLAWEPRLTGIATGSTMPNDAPEAAQDMRRSKRVR